MATSYEPEEATKLQAQAPGLPLARRGIVLLALFAAATSRGHVPRRVAPSITLPEVGLLPRGALWQSLADRRELVSVGVLRLGHGDGGRGRHHGNANGTHTPATCSRRGFTHVRADRHGLHADGKLVVERAAIAHVEVTLPIRTWVSPWPLAPSTAPRFESRCAPPGVQPIPSPRCLGCATLPHSSSKGWAIAGRGRRGASFSPARPSSWRRSFSRAGSQTAFYTWAGAVYGRGWFDRPGALPLLDLCP